MLTENKMQDIYLATKNVAVLRNKEGRTDFFFKLDNATSVTEISGKGMKVYIFFDILNKYLCNIQSSFCTGY